MAKKKAKRPLTKQDQKKTRGGYTPPILNSQENTKETVFETYPGKMPSDGSVTGGAGLHQKRDSE